MKKPLKYKIRKSKKRDKLAADYEYYFKHWKKCMRKGLFMQAEDYDSLLKDIEKVLYV
jgi:hypothetical protein